MIKFYSISLKLNTSTKEFAGLMLYWDIYFIFIIS